MGDSTTGYPPPPGYEAETAVIPETIGQPRPLVGFGSQPGGGAPAAVTGGILDVRPPKRDLRMNRRVLVTQGTNANDDLAFNARSVIIDNETGQWLFEAASRRYVPPGCFGAVLQFPSGSQVLAVTWTAPPGVTQPAGTAGSQALLIYTEDMLDPSSGIIIGGVASSGGTGGAPTSVDVGASRATTATLTNVASSITSVGLLGINAARKGALIYNDSTAILYLSFGAGAASTTSYTVQLASQAYFELPPPSIYSGQLNGIWASANGFARVTELS